MAERSAIIAIMFDESPGAPAAVAAAAISDGSATTATTASCEAEVIVVPAKSGPPAVPLRSKPASFCAFSESWIEIASWSSLAGIEPARPGSASSSRRRAGP